jgi:hypothetical protein
MSLAQSGIRLEQQCRSKRRLSALLLLGKTLKPTDTQHPNLIPKVRVSPNTACNVPHHHHDDAVMDKPLLIDRSGGTPETH